MSEEREWFKGSGLDSRTQLNAEAQRGEMQNFSRMTLGAEALKVLRGVASTHDVQMVIAQMIIDMENRIHNNTRQLLLLPDLNSDEAKALHFDSRVAAGIIGTINNYVRDGQKAGTEIENGDSYG